MNRAQTCMGEGESALALSLVDNEVELFPAFRGEFRRARAAEAVADRELLAGEFVDARNRFAGVGANHPGEREAALGFDRVAALVGGHAAEAHGVLAVEQL